MKRLAVNKRLAQLQKKKKAQKKIVMKSAMKRSGGAMKSAMKRSGGTMKKAMKKTAGTGSGQGKKVVKSAKTVKSGYKDFRAALLAAKKLDARDAALRRNEEERCRVLEAVERAERRAQRAEDALAARG